MANYKKHTWSDGQLITAEALNNIENAIADLEENPLSQEELKAAIDTALQDIKGADDLQAVSYAHAQTIEDTQKQIARDNIGAAAKADLDKYSISDVTKIRINKTNNSNDINYPLLISYSADPLPDSSVEGHLHIDNSKNPTINYSTGTLKASGFAGDGSQLTNINGSNISNGVAIQSLNAQNITNGVLSVTHGGTGANDISVAADNLKVVSTTTLAPAFREDRTYSKNDYCTNTENNRIYRCIAETSQGTWEQTRVNWEGPVVFSSIIADIDNKVNTNVNVMGAATDNAAGTAGQVPAPSAGDQGKFLGGDAQWHEVVTDIDFSRDITGALDIEHGGTGATSADEALENLGVAAVVATLGNNIAQPYSEEATYQIDDYCIYENKLYRCVTAIEEAEAWNEEKWTFVTVMDSITNVASQMNPAAIGAANAADLANAYDATATYKVGDYCVYEGRLYKCTEAIEDGEEWDDAHWESTTVDEAMVLAAEAAANAAAGVVRYDIEQNIGEGRAIARANIGAADANAIDGLTNSINSLNTTVSRLNYVASISQNEGGLVVKYKDNNEQTYSTGLLFDGGEVDENNYLHLKKGGARLSEDVFTPILLPATGGGGGPSGPAISIADAFKTQIARDGKPCPFHFIATSSDDSEIVVNWLVNGVLRLTQNGDSGDKFSFDAKDYLNPSTSDQKVKVQVASTGGGYLERTWTVETVAFAISWEAIEAVKQYTSNENPQVNINVSAMNGVNTVVTVKVNDTVAATRNVTGARTIAVPLDNSLFTTGVNTVTASMASATDAEDKADDIHYMAIWGYGATSPIVAFANETQTVAQYDVAVIQYSVYDPNNEVTNCTIKVGNDEPRTIEAKRTLQKYTYSPLEVEDVTLVLTCGSAQDTMTLHVTQSDYNLTYITEGLNYVVDPLGHSNSDSDRESFGNFTFSDGFDWVNGGFQQDSDGAAAFVVKKGNTVTLPNSLFADNDVAGKTIDLSFKITNSEQYDAVAIRDLNSTNTAQATKGILLRANNGEIRLSNTAGQEFRYCEETRIDLSILVEASSATQRITTVWLDGIPSKVNTYSTNMLVQNDGRMVIGSEHCDVWIYNIRTYNIALSKRDMIQNYVSNGSNTTEKVSRYVQNTILNQNDKITKAALHAAAPNLTLIELQMPRMTYNKKDNVPATVIITDGATELVLPPATRADSDDGTVVKVQGTSSAAYGRSAYNLDIDFKNTDFKYKLSEDAIAVNYLNIKVNVASSENANNVCAVDWYNTYEPYLPGYRNTKGIRDTVEGKPCAVFVTNTSDQNVWFSSQEVKPGETVLYAMGDLCNSKKNKKVFAQSGPADENDTHYTKACIEVSGNDTEPERFRSMSGVTYNTSAGEWQTTEDGKTIKHFEWRMEPSADDLDEVVESWNKTVNWVISTIGNSAKFKAEVGDYFAINSLLYHFLFIEYFAAYDNVSKNTFYSYDYDETAGKYLWNINKAYDMDTILAADNDGKPLGDYGLDYGDAENGRALFNADDNPIWVNIQAAFNTELSNLYTSLRSNGAWNSDAIINKWDEYQHKRPHATMVIDAYNKYIEPYRTVNVNLGDGEGARGHDDSYLPRLQGSKTYWRRQFLTYQTSYMDGKYLIGEDTVKGSAIQFRTNATSGAQDFEIKAYAKTYITALIDSNKFASIKVNTGDTVKFNGMGVGTNTTLYFAPQRLIQYIEPLNKTYNSTFSASGASKLMVFNLGGGIDDNGEEIINSIWPSGTGVSIPSVLLKEMSIKNLTNFTEALDLGVNVELESLDTRGTKTGLIKLPVFAPLHSIQLNACTGIYARNLNKVETFTMESGENLSSIIIENCNDVLSNAVASYLVAAVNAEQTVTRRIRALDVDWNFTSYNILYKLATEWKGYDALGTEQNNSVLTGKVTVPNITARVLATCNEVWPNLDIEYTTLITEYQVTFLNADGTPILDKNGNEYIQYVNQGDTAYDPIEAGEINTPTLAQTAQYTYTFNGWTNLAGTVSAPKNVIANYTETVRTYTVRWYKRVNGDLLDTQTNIAYGSSVEYSNTYPPTITDYEANQLYYVFLGWDKSTSFVTGDLDVYGTWSYSEGLPEVGKKLKDMTLSEIYGIARTNNTSYLDENSYYDIMVGRDFDYSNIESETLIDIPTYFDGTSSSIKIFNGLNGLPAVKLFDEDSPSFTLAIDYEFTESTTNTCLASCSNASGDASAGFRLRYSDNPTVLWGNSTTTVGYGFQRNMLVIRHIKGESTSHQLRLNYHNNSAYYSSNNLSAVSTRGELSAVADGYLVLGGAARYANDTWQTSVPGKGWINWCKIWYQDLGDADTQQLACWPHETWRMEYGGPAKWTDEYTHNTAELFLTNPLSLKYTINTPANMSAFFNKVYSALPIGWQSIIKEVSVNTITSYNNNNAVVTTSLNKLYIPALAEVDAATYSVSDPYRRELNNTDSAYVISGLIDNKSRIKFPGITIDDSFNYIEQAYSTNNSEELDPSNYATSSNPVVSGKTIWIRTDNIPDPDSSYNYDDARLARVGYIYFDKDYCDKHKIICGRNVDDGENITATGPGYTGGKWILASSWWTRTLSNQDNNEMYRRVKINGSTDYNWWDTYQSSSYHAIDFAFSI